MHHPWIALIESEKTHGARTMMTLNPEVDKGGKFKVVVVRGVGSLWGKRVSAPTRCIYIRWARRERYRVCAISRELV